MKKKIAFFVHTLEVGGTEMYLLRFLSFFQKQIDATVYCKSGRTGVLELDFLRIGARIKTCKFRTFDFRVMKFYRKEYIEHGFETVVDFTNNFGAFTMLSAKQIGIKKRIVWYRNADVKFRKTYLRLLLNRLFNDIICDSATDILSNSTMALNLFFKDINWRDDERYEVIHNGIDSDLFLSEKLNLRRELNIPEDAFIVVNVGRYNPQKNHTTAIQVAIELCKKNQNSYFVFVGRLVDVMFANKVKECGLDSRIFLLGNRSDVADILNSCNCFYFPSILEGQPNALIEAMICGLPFLASDIEPIKEAVPAALHSFLLPPLDVRLAVEALTKVMSDSEFRTQLICRDWALQRFNARKQFNKFYEKL